MIKDVSEGKKNYIPYLNVPPCYDTLYSLIYKLSYYATGIYHCYVTGALYFVIYTGCHRRNRPNFGRVFLMLNYTDITQNTYVQS